ncbi:MAG: sugar phosphate isomerase/epimerase [Sphingobacteriales bacterium]|nr:sugar phosphate isomerase/epimerase [Sphingobacteriales bacterium]MBI3719932.1 sugar phosphate isomerase/epimerase [Sphingobacteriales bacterium]
MPINRRKFITDVTLISSTAALGLSFAPKKAPKLSFSTLGCPDWDFNTIVDFAAKNNYSGIEIRGIQRQMDLTLCKEFSKENIEATKALLKQNNLRIVNLGASANLHTAESKERKKNLDEAKRFIDLAQQLNCPYIRVFPNNFPKDQNKQETLQLISNGLIELGNYSKGKNVMVLMETHGDLVHTKDLVTIMQTTKFAYVGLVWDVCNMWVITKQSPKQVYQQLKPWIHHTHIKDAVLKDNNPNYVLLGKGEVPIFEAIDTLRRNNYKGYYSFEWEKLWHPEIAEPEVAIADYPVAMNNHFAN